MAPLLPPEAVDVLRRWVTDKEHLCHPYPDRRQYEELEFETRLTRTQLHNWFSNSRRRFLKPFIFAGKRRAYSKQQQPPQNEQEDQHHTSWDSAVDAQQAEWRPRHQHEQVLLQGEHDQYPSDSFIVSQPSPTTLSAPPPRLSDQVTDSYSHQRRLHKNGFQQQQEKMQIQMEEQQQRQLPLQLPAISPPPLTIPRVEATRSIASSSLSGRAVAEEEAIVVSKEQRGKSLHPQPDPYHHYHSQPRNRQSQPFQLSSPSSSSSPLSSAHKPPHDIHPSLPSAALPTITWLPQLPVHRKSPAARGCALVPSGRQELIHPTQGEVSLSSFSSSSSLSSSPDQNSEKENKKKRKMMMSMKKLVAEEEDDEKMMILNQDHHYYEGRRKRSGDHHFVGNHEKPILLLANYGQQKQWGERLTEKPTGGLLIRAGRSTADTPTHDIDPIAACYSTEHLKWRRYDYDATGGGGGYRDGVNASNIQSSGRQFQPKMSGYPSSSADYLPLSLRSYAVKKGEQRDHLPFPSKITYYESTTATRAVQCAHIPECVVLKEKKHVCSEENDDDLHHFKEGKFLRSPSTSSPILSSPSPTSSSSSSSSTGSTSSSASSASWSSSRVESFTGGCMMFALARPAYEHDDVTATNSYDDATRVAVPVQESRHGHNHDHHHDPHDDDGDHRQEQVQQQHNHRSWHSKKVRLLRRSDDYVSVLPSLSLPGTTTTSTTSTTITTALSVAQSPSPPPPLCSSRSQSSSSLSSSSRSRSSSPSSASVSSSLASSSSSSPAATSSSSSSHPPLSIAVSAAVYLTQLKSSSIKTGDHHHAHSSSSSSSSSNLPMPSINSCITTGDDDFAWRIGCRDSDWVEQHSYCRGGGSGGNKKSGRMAETSGLNKPGQQAQMTRITTTTANQVSSPSTPTTRTTAGGGSSLQMKKKKQMAHASFQLLPQPAPYVLD